ncbi:MAG: chemotaxis protein CheD [Nevskia sp.]|nr:chemotaxis protein CheD [Nevskia sp.]
MSHDSAIDIFLQPGEYFVGDADFRVRTILGSCVSITLWAPLPRLGAMSHSLLASRARPGGEADSRYVDEALELMLAGLAQGGVRPKDCRAKVFGGGNMFPNQKAGGSGRSVGRSNGEAALALLQAKGIPIESQDLFGAGHRQIIFDIRTGDVWSRQTPVATAVAAGRGA